jgi:hypothetical protein
MRARASAKRGWMTKKCASSTTCFWLWVGGGGMGWVLWVVIGFGGGERQVYVGGGGMGWVHGSRALVCCVSATAMNRPYIYDACDKRSTTTPRIQLTDLTDLVTD